MIDTVPDTIVTARRPDGSEVSIGPLWKEVADGLVEMLPERDMELVRVETVQKFDPDQPRDESGRWSSGGGGGEIEVAVSRERPELGGGDVKTYGDVVVARHHPVIAEAERTTSSDLEALGIRVDEQRQVAGHFEGGSEPSLVVELGPGVSKEDIDLAGAYLVRRNEQDSVITNVTGSEMARLGVEPTGRLYQVTGLPTDVESRAQIFERLQAMTPFGSYDEKNGTVEVSVFSADDSEGFRTAFAEFADASGADLAIIDTHTRWYFQDADVRTGASDYLHPADPSVLITADEVQHDQPERGAAIPAHRDVAKRDEGRAHRPHPAGGRGAGPPAAGVGHDHGAQPQAQVGKFDPDQPRDASGRWTSGGGSGGSSSGGSESNPRYDAPLTEADIASHEARRQSDELGFLDRGYSLGLDWAQQNRFDVGWDYAADDVQIPGIEPPISADELRARVEMQLKMVMDSGEARIRAHPDDLLKVLTDGRYKTLHETGTSSGIKDPFFRASEEEKLLGLPKDLPPEDRPVYGYLGGKNDDDEAPVDSYGSVIVRLKDEVKERSTFVIGDSLNNYGAPSPVTSPAATTVQPREGASMLARGVETVDDIGYGHGEKHGASYIELQIQGQVKTSDIKEVVFPPWIRDPFGDVPHVMDKLDELGIPWREGRV